MIEKGASDLHLTTGCAPQLRVDGRLCPLDLPALAPVDTKHLCYSVLTEAQKHRFEEESELDLSFGVKDLSRFRANIFMQRGAVAGAFRAIPFKILTFEELGLPSGHARDRRQAARARAGHRAHGLGQVDHPGRHHRQDQPRSGTSTSSPSRTPSSTCTPTRGASSTSARCRRTPQSFKKALKYILRQDPDVVLIGEMRDLETIEAALTIAETGHLCFATLHTNSAVQTINRIIDVFPSHQQPQVRAQLSFVLEGILSQQLIPRMNGRGRALAVEIMVPNPAIRNLIREDKIHQIYSQMQMGQDKFAMQTMNQSLYHLWGKKLISLEEALGHSSDPEEIRQMIAKGTPDTLQARRVVRAL